MGKVAITTSSRLADGWLMLIAKDAPSTTSKVTGNALSPSMNIPARFRTSHLGRTFRKPHIRPHTRILRARGRLRLPHHPQANPSPHPSSPPTEMTSLQLRSIFSQNLATNRPSSLAAPTASSREKPGTTPIPVLPPTAPLAKISESPAITSKPQARTPFGSEVSRRPSRLGPPGTKTIFHPWRLHSKPPFSSTNIFSFLGSHEISTIPLPPWSLLEKWVIHPFRDFTPRLGITPI